MSSKSCSALQGRHCRLQQYILRHVISFEIIIILQIHPKVSLNFVILRFLAILSAEGSSRNVVHLP